MNEQLQTHPHTHQLYLDFDVHGLTLPRLLHAQRLALFYGDLHNHTAYSDGVGHPQDALLQMRECGLHFAAITDHGEFFDRETTAREVDNWTALAQQVQALTDETFVALRGFEWSSPRQGHSNVWCSDHFTGFHHTGDDTMGAYYEWLASAGALAGFNHPGREDHCFDAWAYVPALDDRIVTLECFNRGDDYGEQYFRALDHGWHVGAIGVSDHHDDDWGSPSLPRAGLLAPALNLAQLQAALSARRVFATRSPTLALLVAALPERDFGPAPQLMGARLRLNPRTPLSLGVWCDDATAGSGWTRLELWTNGGTRIDFYETRSLRHLQWRTTIKSRSGGEQWFAVRVLSDVVPLAYSSPIWATWGTPT
jgi:PHP domain